MLQAAGAGAQLCWQVVQNSADNARRWKQLMRTLWLHKQLHRPYMLQMYGRATQPLLAPVANPAICLEQTPFPKPNTHSMPGVSRCFVQASGRALQPPSAPLACPSSFLSIMSQRHSGSGVWSFGTGRASAAASPHPTAGA
jgi:hypothetical protein